MHQIELVGGGGGFGECWRVASHGIGQWMKVRELA